MTEYKSLAIMFSSIFMAKLKEKTVHLLKKMSQL